MRRASGVVWGNKIAQGGAVGKRNGGGMAGVLQGDPPNVVGCKGRHLRGIIGLDAVIVIDGGCVNPVVSCNAIRVWCIDRPCHIIAGGTMCRNAGKTAAVTIPGDRA
jgi:hypothetical protein